MNYICAHILRGFWKTDKRGPKKQETRRHLQAHRQAHSKAKGELQHHLCQEIGEGWPVPRTALRVRVTIEL